MEKKIRKFLNTKLLAKNIKYSEELNSTQIEAKKLAEQGLENRNFGNYKQSNKWNWHTK